MQKNQIIELQEHFDYYCYMLPAFKFNRAKYDINLIKSHLLRTLVIEQHIEPTIIKKANRFVTFNIGDIHLLHILNFPGGATNLDSCLKTYKTNETKVFFPDECLDCTEKMDKKEPLPYGSLVGFLQPSRKR